MGNALLVVVIFGLAAVIALVVMVYKHLQRPSRDQQALSMLQQQMDALRRDTADAIDKNTRTLGQQSTDITFQLSQRLIALDQGMREVTGQVNTRLDNTLRVIRDVSATMGQLSRATEEMHAIGKDISSLQNILRAPKLRGLVGELFLGNLLGEVVPGCYELQHRFASGETVDAVIRLSQKLVPVDAKFPLENFQRLAGSSTDAERQALRKKFLADVRKHVDAVSRKYILPDEGTFGFALMYIPAENVYYETIIREEADDESLAAYAVERRVIPVSPGTLYAYLQAIVFGLRGMQIEQQAREILDHLGRLQTEFARFREDFDLLGTHLTHARNKYDDASRRVAQLEGKIETGTGESKRPESSVQGPVSAGLLLLALASVAILAPVRAQEAWQQLGPNGAAVAAMAVVPGFPNDLYFVPEGFPGRVWHTQDLGATWSLRAVIPDMVYALAVDPSQVLTMYAAGGGPRMYRSLNGGSSWSVRGTVAENASVRAVTVNPARSVEVWAAADVAGTDKQELLVYRSSNGGSNWTGVVLDSSWSVHACLVAFDPARPHRVFAGGSVGNGPRVFRTVDGGSNWTDVSAGLAGTCAFGLAVSPADSQTLACATDSGLYRSTDLGATWTRRASFPAYSVAFSRQSPYYGYSGSDNLVFRSNDLGLTWSAETTAFAGTLTRWLGLNPSLPLELCVGNGRGVFHSSNGGFSWSEKTSRLRLLTVNTLTFRPDSDRALLGTAAGHGMLTSDDCGRTWTEFGRFPGCGLATGIAANPRHPESVVVVTGPGGRMHLTTDRGASWVSYRIADRFEARGVAFHPLGPETLFAWGGVRDSSRGPARFAVYRSTNSGESWSLNTSRTGPGMCFGLHTGSRAETLYSFGTAGNGPALLRSTDRGRNWTGIAAGISGESIRDFAPDWTVAGLLYCATSAGVYRSRNGGQSWTRLGLSRTSAVLSDPLDTNRLAAATDTQGVFLTTDAGRNWVRDTIALPGRTGLFLMRHPNSPAAVYLGAAGASLLGHNVIGLAEPQAERWTPGLNAVRVEPSIVRRGATVTAGQVTAPSEVNLFHADGRFACSVGRLDPGRPTLTWRRPETLPGGVYLLVLGHGFAAARVVVVR